MIDIDVDDIRSIPILGELVVVPVAVLDVLLNGGEIVLLVVDFVLANVPLIYSLIGTLTTLGADLPLIDASALDSIQEVLIVAVALLYVHRLANRFRSETST